MEMADVVCIQAYIENIYTSLYEKWGTLHADERLSQVYQCINQTLLSCGVPQLLGQGKAKSTSLGQFSVASWKIYLDDSLFFQTTAPTMTHFIDMAAVVYHEGRHAEQNWYIARYLAPKYRSRSFIDMLPVDAKMTNVPSSYEYIDNNHDLSYNAGYLAAFIGMNYKIADKAIRNPLPNSDPMLRQAKIWNDSLCSENPFDRDKRMILHKIATLRKGSPIIPPTLGRENSRPSGAYLEDLVNSKSFLNRAYDNYYARVPVEKDAQQLENRVTQLFTNMQSWKNPS